MRVHSRYQRWAANAVIWVAVSGCEYRSLRGRPATGRAVLAVGRGRVDRDAADHAADRGPVPAGDRAECPEALLHPGAGGGHAATLAARLGAARPRSDSPRPSRIAWPRKSTCSEGLLAHAHRWGAGGAGGGCILTGDERRGGVGCALAGGEGSASSGVELLTGHTRDESRLFQALSGAWEISPNRTPPPPCGSWPRNRR